MRFDIFTLFPRMFDSPFAESIIRRAINAGLIEIHTHNIRDYATDKHRTTDDYPFGGGSGMVLKPEPIFAAVESVLGVPLPKDVPIILMSPSGRTFTHAVAKELAQYQRIALICGHYEGVDERVREHLCTDAISIGDYVLTGGEIPAMVIVDAVSRLVPGVLPPEVTAEESHASGLLEYPHYTRPAEFRGWRVPEVLLSGNHAAIARWRREQAEARTRTRKQALGHCAEAAPEA
ncbi:MAG: tRNA (guanosine(37)-N1)-methyltransferase TrmD [Thermoflexales bacterium]|nr:tRNA (guanosine(37)-N1)-methyltransferase TrmD [Thermoflexales bacterium]MCS7324174.1 tRNA (guanosine(37)-N1)-methyltransferase TrmD [Thermoflexales bacterium]MDW8053251.1 tRNA (guanosine(37)-N1)-methyltransferase TrmD [Anaerolineae bacterium]MDW8291902.1 tRNA (guanosine(37)-N1)-methyltransferase TrmD [Anaerolineae bacterium]